MAHKHAQLEFTETVRAMQQEQSSDAVYATMDPEGGYNSPLSKVEAFDCNRPRLLTARYSESELESLITPLTNEISQLKLLLKEQLKSQLQANLIQKNSPTNYPQTSGEGELPLVISGIRQLSPRIRAIELRHVIGEALPVFEAGAHISIPVVLKDGKLTHRHYSISSNPSRTDCYEIAVLNDQSESGEPSASAIIHQHFTLGLRLNCSLPENYFPLEYSKASVVLIAGGIGITPIKAMALTLTRQQREFSLHYCGRSLNEMAFSDRLTRQFGNKLTLYVADESNKLNLKKLLQTSPQGAHFYFCGPKKMLKQLLNIAKRNGIATSRLHFERFYTA